MTVTSTESLEAVHTLVEPKIRLLLDRLDLPTRLVAGYHLGYWDASGAPGIGGGKSLRPALALLSARAGGACAARGVPAAVAVELAHNFSLLHDDVMDSDAQRRHRPTAWAVFGTAAAILAGDALLSLAAETVGTAPEAATTRSASRCLGLAVQRLIAGQAADLSFERYERVGVAEYLAMAWDKTAALLSCASSLGAVLCDAPPRTTIGLARFGGHLGMAYQFVDDLLGIWGVAEHTGKPVLSDLRARKKTAPVVWAASSGTRAGEAFGELYRTARELRPAELALAAHLLEECGARKWTEHSADERLAAALSELDRLPIAADVHAELAGLARFVTARDH